MAASPNQWAAANTATVANQSDPTATDVSTVQTPAAAYGQALEAAYAPQFKQNQQALDANQAANGTLVSGAGNYGQQQLAAQDNALIAQGELPLIQQGYNNANNDALANAAARNSMTGLGYSTRNANAQQNANAGNALESQLQNEAYGAATNNANNSLQAQEFNAGLSNSNYQQALQDQYGILNGGLSARNATIGQGVGEQQAGYQNGYQIEAQGEQALGKIAAQSSGG